MSRKQDEQSRKGTKTLPEKPQEQTDEGLNLQEALAAKHLSAAQVRTLQARLGNREVTAMLAERNAGLVEESAEEEQEPEKEREELRTRRPAASSLSAGDDNPGGSTGKGSEFWARLFGGDDDESAPTPLSTQVRRRRRQPWQSARKDHTGKNSTDPGHHLGPRRPDVQEHGHRFFYAMDCWLSDPEAWSNPDTSAYSLVDLQPWHPLSRCHRAGRFWESNGLNPRTRELSRSIQSDPVATGHCSRISRAVGLLALTQAAEAEALNAQRVADVTAVALQESAMTAIEQLAAEAMLSTDQLFQFAVIAEYGGPPKVPTHSDLAHKDCAILLAALRFALPKQPLPALLWVPNPKAIPSQSEVVERVDALLSGSADPLTMLLRDLAAPLDSASKLLDSCGEMRLDFSAAALALWRTCGQSHYHAMRGLLAAADTKLRKTALSISYLLEEIEALADAPKESAHAELEVFQKQLETDHLALGHLEVDVHAALVRLCTSENATPSPWQPQPGDSEALEKQWKNHESRASPKSEEQTALLAHCWKENNPWLCFRAEADWTRMGAPPDKTMEGQPHSWLKNKALTDLLRCTMLEEATHLDSENLD
jgi:hypothetical protein